MSEFAKKIEAAWDARDSLSVTSKGEHRDAVEAVLEQLDNGMLRSAEKVDGAWKANEWVKKAILLSFRLNDNKLIEGGPGGGFYWDKVDPKFIGWDEARFRAAGFRVLPGAVVRRSAFISRGAVLLPSFVNVGARVGEGSMIDTWATVGSCAQIGAHCHISGGPASAAFWSRCRPPPPSSRIIASSAPAPRWPRASSWAKAACCRWASISPPPPASSTAPRARCISARCRPIRWWCRVRRPPAARCLRPRPSSREVACSASRGVAWAPVARETRRRHAASPAGLGSRAEIALRRTTPGRTRK